jgi:hypothetical protein
MLGTFSYGYYYGPEHPEAEVATVNSLVANTVNREGEKGLGLLLFTETGPADAADKRLTNKAGYLCLYDRKALEKLKAVLEKILEK